MSKQSHYVMAKLHYPATGVIAWHPAYEAESASDAEEFKAARAPMPYEVDCVIVPGAPSGDCRELRPC
jgi:hypothetical protein